MALLPGGAELLCLSREAGDFARPGSPVSQQAQVALTGAAWTWCRQVHGAAAVVSRRPGDRAGEEADAIVSDRPGLALAVMTADCAPIGLSSPEGVGAIVHAGWRGLMAGVVQEAVQVMRALGAGTVGAALGPCVHPHAYRFSSGDLATVVERFGPGVRGRDAGGGPALDLPAAVRSALDEAGAELVDEAGTCTHCSAHHWSWRARADTARQANLLLTGEGRAGPTAAGGWAP